MKLSMCIHQEEFTLPKEKTPYRILKKSGYLAMERTAYHGEKKMLTV